jgi:dienelactone hydrolase
MIGCRFDETSQIRTLVRCSIVAFAYFVNDTGFAENNLISTKEIFLPSSPRASAFVVQSEQAGKNRKPAIIFLHSATSHKDSFLEEAKDLAKLGAISILPDAPYGRSEWKVPRGIKNPDKELEVWKLTCDELSLWVDLLLSRYQVDPERVIFIGRNLGGGVGGFWMTTEHRIYAALLTGAIPDLSNFWATSPHPVAVKAREGANQSHLDRSRSLLQPTTDLTTTLSVTKAKMLFLQFGKQDDWLTEKAVEALNNAAKNPKKLEWLNDDHDMNSIESKKSRFNWVKNLIK